MVKGGEGERERGREGFETKKQKWEQQIKAFTLLMIKYRKMVD